MKRSKRCRSGSSTTYVAFSVTSRMQAGAVCQKQWKIIRNEMQKSKIKQFNSTDSQLSMMYFTISLLPKPTAWWRRVQPKRSWTDRLAPPSSCIWTSWEHEVHEVWECRALMYDIAGIGYLWVPFRGFQTSRHQRSNWLILKDIEIIEVFLLYQLTLGNYRKCMNMW